MKDVSIEYAHIYTNSKINEEQEFSLKILNEVREPNESLVVLIDDYSFPDPSFDYDSFTGWLTDRGYPPNLVMRESQLIPQCDQVLEAVSEPNLKKELRDYIKSKKYPCSLFIATWYLLRLGFLEHPMFPKSEHASRLINILPESFKPFEDRGFEIIKNTRFSEAARNIENRYFKGRSIA